MINTGPWGIRRERWLCEVEQSIAPLVSSIHHHISNHGRNVVDRSRSVQNFRSSPAALHHRHDRTWTPSISLSETLELELIPLAVIIHPPWLFIVVTTEPVPSCRSVTFGFWRKSTPTFSLFDQHHLPRFLFHQQQYRGYSWLSVSACW